MALLKQKLSKKQSFVLAIISFIIISIGIIISARFVFNCVSVENSVHVEEKNNVSYSVHYDKNDFFNPDVKLDEKKKQSYLLGYTDFVKVSNSYSAEFSRKVIVDYEMIATKTLIIRYIKNGSTVDAPIVLEKEYPLNNKKSNIKSNKINSEQTDYIINLKEYQAIYDKFVVDELKRAHASGLPKEQKLQFSAELRVDFKYLLKNSDNKMNQSLVRGLTIPITDQVYSITFEGTPEASYDVPQRVLRFPNLFVAILFALMFTIATLGLIHGIKGLRRNPDKFLEEVRLILHKYSDDIVVAAMNIEFMRSYTHVQIDNFRDLLKISSTQSKPITCHHDLKQGWATFFIFCDGLIYEYYLRR